MGGRHPADGATGQRLRMEVEGLQPRSRVSWFADPPDFGTVIHVGPGDVHGHPHTHTHTHASAYRPPSHSPRATATSQSAGPGAWTFERGTSGATDAYPFGRQEASTRRPSSVLTMMPSSSRSGPSSHSRAVNSGSHSPSARAASAITSTGLN